MSELDALGWDEGWAAAFAGAAPEGTVPARVSIEFNHIYQVISAGGEQRAQMTGRLRHRAAGRHELASVGDWVAIRETPGEASAVIEAILPRRSTFSRKVAGALTEEQIVASNIDTVFLVMGLDHDFNPRRLERYLVTSFDSGARPVVILSKADLCADLGPRLAEVEAVAVGVPIHATTAVRRLLASGETIEPDVQVVESYLGPGRTGALLGSSGAGKSTLINALLGTPKLKTADVRAHDSRGRHTTRHRQLLVLPGRGVLIDTPGMRELQLWDAGEGGDDAFEEIAALADACHFTDCRHRDEPRCAVKSAVAAGQVSSARLASFHKLQDEQAALDARRDERAQMDARRTGRSAQKALRHLYKLRGRK